MSFSIICQSFSSLIAEKLHQSFHLFLQKHVLDDPDTMKLIYKFWYEVKKCGQLKSTVVDNYKILRKINKEIKNQYLRNVRTYFYRTCTKNRTEISPLRLKATLPQTNQTLASYLLITLYFSWRDLKNIAKGINVWYWQEYKFQRIPCSVVCRILFSSTIIGNRTLGGVITMLSIVSSNLIKVPLLTTDVLNSGEASQKLYLF